MSVSPHVTTWGPLNKDHWPLTNLTSLKVKVEILGTCQTYYAICSSHDVLYFLHQRQFGSYTNKSVECDLIASVYTVSNIAVTLQKPMQVTSCCNLLAPVRQLSFNNRSAKMSFSQVQRVFIVEHCLASCSLLNCQNEFRDTFPDSSVPNKSTIYRLVNRFRELCISNAIAETLHRVASDMRKIMNACIDERSGHF
jgi:hypothetical protein